ncbi:uncharacterized protein LOC142330422 [Lycorma delicatula]|uniref:uncharacterized protein LOC142330422 n=1 Tax=Lycorma delicatula TaxID=130591 RepID=UPI003F513B03
MVVSDLNILCNFILLINNGILCKACLRESFQAFQEGITPFITDIFQIKANLPDDEPRRCGEMNDLCRFESDCCPENHCMMTAGENIGSEGVVNMCFPKEIRTEPLTDETITIVDDFTELPYELKTTTELKVIEKSSQNHKPSYIPDIFNSDNKISWAPIELNRTEADIDNEYYNLLNKYKNQNDHSFNKSNKNDTLNIENKNKNTSIININKNQSPDSINLTNIDNINENKTRKEFQKILDKEFSKAVNAVNKFQHMLNNISAVTKNNRVPRSDEEKYKKFIKFMKKSRKNLKKNINILKNPFPKCLKIIKMAILEFGRYKKELPKMFFDIETKLDEVVKNMTKHLNQEVLNKIQTLKEDKEEMDRDPPDQSIFIEKQMTADLELLKLKIKMMYDVCKKAAKKYLPISENSSKINPKKIYKY